MTSENTAPVSEREWVMVPFGGPVTLLDCPPGPFLFDGCLGFRSEYATTTPRNRYQPDAYVMDSGEYFWGGTSNTLERSQLIVQPLVAKARQIAALQGTEGGHAGKLESAPTGGASQLLGGEQRFFLSTDGDSHWYLVPEANRAEWQAWADLDPDDERAWEPPAYAKPLGGGPQGITFTNPQGLL